MFTLCIFAIIAMATAFRPMGARQTTGTQLYMKNDIQKLAAAAAIGASMFLGGNMAKAEIDYEGIKYLGGGDKVDLNNANIRAYLKFPGMYPSIAGKVVTSGPFKSVGDVYNIPSLTGPEKDILKKYESRFLTLDVKPEYDIDKINNGLYR